MLKFHQKCGLEILETAVSDCAHLYFIIRMYLGRIYVKYRAVAINLTNKAKDFFVSLKSRSYRDLCWHFVAVVTVWSIRSTVV